VVRQFFGNYIVPFRFLSYTKALFDQIHFIKHRFKMHLKTKNELRENFIKMWEREIVYLLEFFQKNDPTKASILEKIPSNFRNKIINLIMEKELTDFISLRMVELRLARQIKSKPSPGSPTQIKPPPLIQTADLPIPLDQFIVSSKNSSPSIIPAKFQTKISLPSSSGDLTPFIPKKYTNPRVLSGSLDIKTPGGTPQ
jgi:hypothetical protein